MSALLSRRSFLGRTAAAIGCCAYAGMTGPELQANPLGLPIGFQGFDARLLLIKDWDGGWKELRAIGFQSVDLVSFKGYGYGQSALANMSATDIRKELDSVGMACDNCQFAYDELHGQFDEKMSFSHDLGLKNIICAPAPEKTQTVDDWKWQADRLNELGEKVRKSGFRLGYHNHDLEFTQIEGTRPYDVLMEHTDPKIVSFQIDVGNLTFGGADAIEYLDKYAGRYFSMHAKDYLPGKTSVPVGQGILNWKKIFHAAKKSRIENYFAEVAAYGFGTLHGMPAAAWPTDSIDQLRQSYNFLHKLSV
jgi:sugar phosphate isomerase/epimerase